MGGFEKHASGGEGRNTHAYAGAFTPTKVVARLFNWST